LLLGCSVSVSARRDCQPDEYFNKITYLCDKCPPECLKAGPAPDICEQKRANGYCLALIASTTTASGSDASSTPSSGSTGGESKNIELIALLAFFIVVITAVVVWIAYTQLNRCRSNSQADNSTPDSSDTTGGASIPLLPQNPDSEPTAPPNDTGGNNAQPSDVENPGGEGGAEAPGNDDQKTSDKAGTSSNGMSAEATDNDGGGASSSPQPPSDRGNQVVDVMNRKDEGYREPKPN
ncbi:hypothetical protein BOX15_Mlig007169g1, partial [Macrostomum lignano]